MDNITNHNNGLRGDKKKHIYTIYIYYNTNVRVRKITTTKPSRANELFSGQTRTGTERGSTPKKD